MAKIPLIAQRSFLYAGRRLAAGVEFGARTQSDARLLIAIGHADFAPQGPVEPEQPQPWSMPQAETPAPQPAAVVEEPPPVEVPEAPAVDEAPPSEPPAAEADVQPDISPRTGKPRRSYRRRDLTAEGSE